MTHSDPDPQPGAEPLDLQDLFGSLPSRSPVSPVDDVSYPDPKLLLAKVIDHYLNSHEFNGLPIGESAQPHDHATGLVANGLVQVVTTTDYLNPHIRPWARDDTDRQIEELLQVADGALSGCLYPTARAMAEHSPALTHKHPYRDRMILGAGTLDLAFFDLASLEGYMNDPDFAFQFSDDGFTFSTSPEAARTDDEALHLEAGYAYDHTVDYQGDEIIRRYWTAFMCDLRDLPARHQTRLSTFERPAKDLIPHPDWWSRQIGGQWLDHIGPFTKVLWELEAINEVWNLAFGARLLKTTERPRAWGWVLRPTTGSWNEFIHLTDKLLSDNLLHKGLDAAGAPRADAEGNRLGTMKRLEELIIRSSSADEEEIRRTLQPLRDVRKERQGPAHKISDTAADAEAVNRQRDLLRDIAHMLTSIRYFFQSHPSVHVAGWQPRNNIDNWRWL